MAHVTRCRLAVLSLVVLIVLNWFSFSRGNYPKEPSTQRQSSRESDKNRSDSRSDARDDDEAARRPSPDNRAAEVQVRSSRERETSRSSDAQDASGWGGPYDDQAAGGEWQDDEDVSPTSVDIKPPRDDRRSKELHTTAHDTKPRLASDDSSSPEVWVSCDSPALCVFSSVLESEHEKQSERRRVISTHPTAPQNRGARRNHVTSIDAVTIETTDVSVATNMTTIPTQAADAHQLDKTAPMLTMCGHPLKQVRRRIIATLRVIIIYQS